MDAIGSLRLPTPLKKSGGSPEDTFYYHKEGKRGKIFNK